MAGGVRERLLEDPVGAPVDAGRKRAHVPARRRSPPPGPRRGGARPGRRARPRRRGLHPLAVPRPSSRRARTIWSISPTVSRATSSIVPKAARAAGGSRSVLQAAEPGVDQDHVDRVAGGVVQVAGDADALLGGRQAAVALGVALGALRPLLELGHALAAQPGAIAGQPGAAPDNTPNTISGRGSGPHRSPSRSACATSSRRPARPSAACGHATRLRRRPSSRARCVGPSGGPAGSATAAKTTLAGRLPANTARRGGGGRPAAARREPRGTPRGHPPCHRRRLARREQTDRRGEDRDGDRCVDHERLGLRGRAGCGLRPSAARVAPLTPPRIAPAEDAGSPQGVRPNPPARAFPATPARRTFVGVPPPRLEITVPPHTLGARPQAHRRRLLGGSHHRGHGRRRARLARARARVLRARQGGLGDQRRRSPSATGAPAATAPRCCPSSPSRGQDDHLAGRRADLARLDGRLRRPCPARAIASYASTGDGAFVSRDGRTTFALVYPTPDRNSTFGENPKAERAARSALRGATVGRPAGAPDRLRRARAGERRRRGTWRPAGGGARRGGRAGRAHLRVRLVPGRGPAA